MEGRDRDQIWRALPLLSWWDWEKRPELLSECVLSQDGYEAYSDSKYRSALK